MKKQLIRKQALCLIAILGLTFISSSVFSQSKDEIINSSYFVAFGRYANSGELNYWRQNVGSRSIPQMVNNHKDYIKSNQNEREQTVRRSYMDAFGWQPSSDELRYWSSQNKTYAELMSNHIKNWLNVYPDKKEAVVRQSYYKVFGRNATTAEVKYWKGMQTYSYVQLVAMHTTWKQNNQSSSSVTNIKPNLNTNGISTSTLSPQAISGVVAAGGGNVVAAGGGNVVAAGGANAVAAGGLN
jgi:hypothetical protein